MRNLYEERVALFEERVALNALLLSQGLGMAIFCKALTGLIASPDKLPSPATDVEMLAYNIHMNSAINNMLVGAAIWLALLCCSILAKTTFTQKTLGLFTLIMINVAGVLAGVGGELLNVHLGEFNEHPASVLKGGILVGTAAVPALIGVANANIKHTRSFRRGRV